MSSTRRMLTLLLVSLLVTFGLATAIAPRPWNYGPCHSNDDRKAVAPAAGNGDSSFSQLLDSASQDSLHDLLHRYFPKTYRHGVYPSDASAMEAVHRANAALASSLVRMARRDNTTTTTTTAKPPPPPTTTTTTTTNAPPTDTSPPPAGTTDAPPPSSTDNPPDTTASSTTSATTSMGTSATAGPAPSSKPVTSTYTSVINGTPTIVIATSYVAVSPQDATKTRPSGSLQTNAAAAGHHRGLVMEAVVGAVIGGAMLI